MRTRTSEREQGPVAARTRNRLPAEDISLPPVTRTARKRTAPASQDVPKSEKRGRHTPKQEVAAAPRAAKRSNRSSEAAKPDEGGPSRRAETHTQPGKKMSNTTSEDAEEQQEQTERQSEEQVRLSASTLRCRSIDLVLGKAWLWYRHSKDRHIMRCTVQLDFGTHHGLPSRRNVSKECLATWGQPTGNLIAEWSLSDSSAWHDD